MRTVDIYNELAEDNPVYFGKGQDVAFDVVAREYVELIDGRYFMLEHHIVSNSFFSFDQWSVRAIGIEDGKYVIEAPEMFDTHSAAIAHLAELETTNTK